MGELLMEGEFQRCLGCGFQFDYLNSSFRVCTDCVGSGRFTKGASDPATEVFVGEGDFEYWPFGQPMRWPLEAVSVVDAEDPDENELPIDVGERSLIQTLNELGRIDVWPDDVNQKADVERLIRSEPSIPRGIAVGWISAGFSVDQVLASHRMGLQLADALMWRGQLVLASEFLEYMDWVGDFRFSEIVAWNEAGLRPEDKGVASDLRKLKIRPGEASSLLKIVGRRHIGLIALLKSASIPINESTLRRWKGLDLKVVTPARLLTLIDRGFVSGPSTVGFELVPWDYLRIDFVSRELGFDTPQGALGLVSIEGFGNLLELIDAGLLSSQAWGWVVEGFGASEALDWSEVLDNQSHAAAWKGHGFTTSDVVAWREVGVDDPSEAKLWLLSGFGPNDSRRWREVGLGPSEAVRWQAVDVEPIVAKRRTDQGIGPP